MTLQDARRMLIPPDKVGVLEYQNFGDACRDPQAAILAVNDFESFKRVFAERSVRKTREDRLQRLYSLYLALSRVKLIITKESIELFKSTIPGYERVSTHLFVKDILCLINHRVAILSTPILDAIQSAETTKSQLIALQKQVTGNEEPHTVADALVEDLLKSRIKI